MSNISSFKPDWIVPPGAIIQKAMQKRKIDIDELAAILNLSVALSKDLLEGYLCIDTKLAEQLARTLGSTPAFWISCEENFIADKVNNSHLVSDENDSWCNNLPVKELVKLGWMRHHENRQDVIEECFRFFGVFQLDAWKTRYAEMLSSANYRTSSTFSSEPYATAAWLRYAELKADEQDCSSLDPRKLQSNLASIRLLSRIHDPRRFLPKLKSICASCGVALVVAPTPSACKASGATFLLRKSKAVLVLSHRFGSDDHFWFTFFHEAGHILLHGGEKIFIEGSENEADQREEEANKFARKTLVPDEFFEEMTNLPPRYNEYIKLALKLGIAPGIIVGQMQHLGKIDYRRLNKLKRRFDWAEVAESAVIP